jgi:uncharacterized protein YjbI with pentapeptide repeats
MKPHLNHLLLLLNHNVVELKEENLSAASPKRASPSVASLSEASLSEASLSEASLSEASLSEASLSEASLSEASPRRVERGANKFYLLNKV